MKTFKISTDCQIKTCRSLKRGLFWKSLVPFFRRIYALSVGFKVNSLRKSDLNFAVKLAERSNHSILLSVWWITFFKHLYSVMPSTLHNTLLYYLNFLVYVIVECIELNWMYKHMEKVRSSQAVILVQNWVKHSFSLWISLKNILWKMSFSESLRFWWKYFVGNSF